MQTTIKYIVCLFIALNIMLTPRPARAEFTTLWIVGVVVVGIVVYEIKESKKQNK